MLSQCTSRVKTGFTVAYTTDAAHRDYKNNGSTDRRLIIDDADSVMGGRCLIFEFFCDGMTREA